jgi:alkyl hydroperoxide reductase subunit AhpC
LSSPERCPRCSALFIINPEGVVRQITINDLPVGRSVLETVRLVRAFQHADVHGEVCPAGWMPGDAAMVPDVADSKAFFRSDAWARASDSQRTEL